MNEIGAHMNDGRTSQGDARVTGESGRVPDEAHAEVQAWDDAGCFRRSCERGHSYEWGRCAYAQEPPPRPRLYRHDVVPDTDGCMSIVVASMDPAEVADWLREQGYEREWNPGDPPLLPPAPEDCYPPDSVPLESPPPSRWPVAEMLARQLAEVKAQRDALRAYVEQDLGVKKLVDAYCGQLSVHAPHVVTHGPDQPRLCPGRPLGGESL